MSNQLDIETVMNMWAEDSKIDRNQLQEESLKASQLHQKYLQILMQVKTKLLKSEKDFNDLRLKKYRWFRGEMSQDELKQLGWPQYQGLKPLKTDMEFVLEHDPDVGNLNIKIQYLKNMVYQLESILNSIKGRDWAIRNHIEYTKFVAGF